ncbi:phosphodiester glycosidase family protein [Fictibacillus phosphorivorans]|uniref:phosphodiester glycosidase family protein n=1 Tax=Fictibacillus phosphorivorans TaxID=1221500 RepID=UPI00203C1AE1|nr:phosphodiester glycosidase family protein [Fictibacillus phosphorivorans]MCM3717327.1 phosphodiester glycosidase family protein [Fictibacillus phosphorivorans]MCM3775022.1 phosphodiester glycosidase family protein [Fictibacillus phosphorivorans]
MKNHWKKKWLPVVLAFSVISSTVAISPHTTSALGEFDLTSEIVQTPINQYRADLAPGIKEKHYSFEGKEGKKIESFVVDVDVHNQNVAIEAGTPDDSDGFGLQPVRAQAKAEDRENHRVVAAVNADFYNMATGEPHGIVYKDGRLIKDYTNRIWNFFGIKKDGTAIIGNSTDYEAVKSEIKEALGGNAILVKDGSIYQTPKTGQDKEPRTAVGIKADGDVFFTVIDGRQEPYSAGISMEDLAQLMIDLGAVTALNLDGGGSSTFATRQLGTDNLEVDNQPSDRTERSVANSWLVVNKEPSDHVFHSAYIEPYDKSFTPGSTIELHAKGMDKSFAPAPLPDNGLIWELSDSSFGTIENGQFISNGKTGQFHILLKHNGQEVGNGIIEIESPDEMFFGSNELTVARNSETPLELITRFQKRNVKWNLQDIEFDIPDGMGTIDENGVFHAGDQNSKGTITAKGTSLEANIYVTVGQLPIVLHDFEEGLENWKTSTANRGEKGTLTLSEYPDPVRFDEHSLRLDFDFTNAQSGTTLGVYAGPGSHTPIEGNPSSIGMWVYGTPEAQGYWLRMYIVDGNGKNQTINLTEENPGIDWMGWKYIEAEIPSSFTGPFKLSGTQAIRMMSTKSGITGPMTKGSILFDNIRAVYGEKVDDLYPPVIHSVNTDGEDFTSNEITISANVNEYEEDPFKTGIDWDKIRFFVDDIDYANAEGHFSYDMDGSVSLSGFKWADGTHKVTVIVPDKFGNQAIHTSYFTVNTESAKVNIHHGQEEPYLGADLNLLVNTIQNDEISSSSIQMKIDKNYPVKEVLFSDHFHSSTSSYNEKTGILTLELVNSGETAESVDAATIKVGVPASTKEGSHFAYELIKGDITYKEPKEEDFIPTFSMEPVSIPVKAALGLNHKPILIGKPTLLSVKDNNGDPVENAEIFAVIDGDKDPFSLGTTNSNGKLQVDSISEDVKKLTLYAVKDGKYSFNVETQTYTALVSGSDFKNILSSTTGNPYQTKGFTWMSSPLANGKSAFIQYAKKADYERKGASILKKQKGTSSDEVFSGELDIKKNGIVRVNGVTLKKLQQNTTYVYRVGDGEHWSDLKEFTTLKRKQSFDFAVLGDTQSPSDLSHLEKILGELDQKDSAFMIHVGDIIDESSKFNQWDQTLGVFSKYENIRSTDLVAALGNHEYMGDADGSLAKAILNFPKNGPEIDKGGTYSVDYNNMHISVLGYSTNETILDQQLQWLKKDMKRSDKPWKILVTHQPPYYTNPFGGNEKIKEKIPPIADELGIDIVFSGHDHSYGRTKKLKNGQENSNGTVYVVAGTTGNKHYDAIVDDKFEFVNTDNIAVFMRAQVNKDKITFTTTTSDGEFVDEFTVVNEDYKK